MAEDVNDLFRSDSGDDQSVKSQDIEQFRVVKDKKHRICQLLPEHFWAFVHSWSGGENQFKTFYCKKDKGAKCCELDKAAPEKIWFNVVFEYVLDQKGRPAMPLQGQVLFFKIKRTKYINIREKLAKVREERGDSIRLDEFDLDVALDGDEDYQKMNFTHNLRSALVLWATLELKKGIIAKEIKAGNGLTDAMIADVIKENEEYAKAVDKEKFVRKVTFPIDVVKKNAPVFKTVMEEANDILKRVPKFTKFASNLSNEDIIELYKGKPAGDVKEIKASEMGVSESDMSQMLKQG